MGMGDATVVRVAVEGLNETGFAVLRLLARQPWVELTGAVAGAGSALVGQYLGELIGETDRLGGARVHETFADLRKLAPAEVYLDCRGGRACDVLPRLRPVAEWGWTILTVSEEMLYPALTAEEEAMAFDRLCHVTGARCAAVAPVLAGALEGVVPLLAMRLRAVEELGLVQSGGVLPMPLAEQGRLGLGLDEESFRERFAANTVGQPGLQEAACSIGEALGWDLEEIVHSCEPIMTAQAPQQTRSPFGPGKVCGFRQTVRGRVGLRFPLSITVEWLPHDDPLAASVVLSGSHTTRLQMENLPLPAETRAETLVRAILPVRQGALGLQRSFFPAPLSMG